MDTEGIADLARVIAGRIKAVGALRAWREVIETFKGLGHLTDVYKANRSPDAETPDSDQFPAIYLDGIDETP